jgi:hypothetical protein
VRLSGLRRNTPRCSYDRDEPGDREKAIELQDKALTITQELGMRPLTDRIQALREIRRA